MMFSPLCILEHFPYDSNSVLYHSSLLSQTRGFTSYRRIFCLRNTALKWAAQGNSFEIGCTLSPLTVLFAGKVKGLGWGLSFYSDSFLETRVLVSGRRFLFHAGTISFLLTMLTESPKAHLPLNMGCFGFRPSGTVFKGICAKWKK